MITLKQLNTMTLSKNINGLIDIKIGDMEHTVRNWTDIKELFEIACYVRPAYAAGKDPSIQFDVYFSTKTKTTISYPENILKMSKQEIYDALYDVVSKYWEIRDEIDAQADNFNQQTIKYKK